MILTKTGDIRDINTQTELTQECELSETSDPAARISFLVMLMSQGILAGNDAAYGACEIELDELLSETQ